MLGTQPIGRHTQIQAFKSKVGESFNFSWNGQFHFSTFKNSACKVKWLWFFGHEIRNQILKVFHNRQKCNSEFGNIRCVSVSNSWPGFLLAVFSFVYSFLEVIYMSVTQTPFLCLEWNTWDHLIDQCTSHASSLPPPPHPTPPKKNHINSWIKILVS